MGITLSTLGAVFAPLQGLFGWGTPRPSRAQVSPQARLAVPHVMAGPRAPKAAHASPCEKARKPLRVVRVVEHCGAPGQRGPHVHLRPHVRRLRRTRPPGGARNGRRLVARAQASRPAR